MRVRSILASLAVASLVAPVPAHAQGVFLPTDPSAHADGRVAVEALRVEADVHGPSVRAILRETLVNLIDQAQEGSLLIPVPSEIAVGGYAIDAGGERVAAEIVPRDKARARYEEIVRRRRDPGILEFANDGLLETRVFPIAPGGRREIAIEWSGTLSSASGLFEMRLPMPKRRVVGIPPHELSFVVRVDSPQTITSVYSPTHEVAVERGSDHQAIVRYKGAPPLEDPDFLLYYKVTEGDVGASLLTYREPGDPDGTFLLLVTPRPEMPSDTVVGRDVVFVLDHSGSMKTDGKIDQARRAFEFCVGSLNPADRFNVVTFNDHVETLFDSLRAPDPPCCGTASPRADAIAKLRTVQADGGTDIQSALLAALDKLGESSRPQTIVFLTDGQATVGERDPAAIAAAVMKRNEGRARLFVFGVGYDVNTALLNSLSTENRGVADYVSPGEDIEVKVSQFYSRIGKPVLSDVSVEFSGVATSDIYPKIVPDLFLGQDLLLVGHFSGSGGGAVTLRGRLGDRAVDMKWPVRFPDGASPTSRSFVARLWALRRIGHLVEEIRLHGRSQELVDSVVSLSTRFGILTEYTAFLTEDGVSLTAHVSNVARCGDLLTSNLADVSGAHGVAQSRNSESLKSRAQVGGQNVQRGVDDRWVEIGGVQCMGRRTLWQKHGEWIDGSVKDDAKTVDVPLFSVAYFDLVKRLGDEANVLALRGSILIALGGTNYRVVPEVAATPR
ncbi:MAG: VWA domain-containing protein [Planctomycetes bacterium]|nr:VWA domain-containing protein [Planctomycetota bacterium]MBI3846597.1 VWA domain-containing protein [Planctomycetota bacterium]